MNVLDLFSGIGGFSLGLERAGMRTVAFCEIEPFCRAVLRKHWPDVPCFEDVRKLTAADVGSIDVICGGFPCQDISSAGKGAGINGNRSGLWAEYARLVGELRPKFIIVENVAMLLSRGINRVLGDLAALGYDAEWHCISASAIGAPHIRDRVWIVAYPNGYGLQAQSNKTAICEPPLYRALRGRFSKIRSSSVWRGAQPIGARPVGVGNGFSEELDAIRAYGNAVVPQIPEIIGRAIMQAEGLS